MAIVIHPSNFFGTNRIRVAVTLIITRKSLAKPKGKRKMRKCNSYGGKINYRTPIVSTTTFTFLAHVKCGRYGVRIDNDNIDLLHIQKFALYRVTLQP